jgi:hypothetical protein
LTDVIRQKDQNFCNALSKLREGDYDAAKWIQENSSKELIEGGIYLCSTNDEASRINKSNLDKITNPSQSYLAEIDNVSDNELPCEKTLILKPQCRVVSLVNDTSCGEYRNGSLGTVIKCNKNNVLVKWDSGYQSVIEPYTWEKRAYEVNKKNKNKLSTKKVGEVSQIPLRLAYAITIHKSQGQTFEKVNVKPYCFASGQLYVALSRCTNIENLYIDGRIQPSFVKADKDVVDFFNDPDSVLPTFPEPVAPEGSAENTQEPPFPIPTLALESIPELAPESIPESIPEPQDESEFEYPLEIELMNESEPPFFEGMDLPPVPPIPLMPPETDIPSESQPEKTYCLYGIDRETITEFAIISSELKTGSHKDTLNQLIAFWKANH